VIAVCYGIVICHIVWLLAGDGAGSRRHVGRHPWAQQYANRPGVGDLSHVPARTGLQQRHTRPSVSHWTANTLGPRTRHTQQLPSGLSVCYVLELDDRLSTLDEKLKF